MDDGDSHPASDNFNQIDSVEKHNLLLRPETSGQALQAEREERISNT